LYNRSLPGYDERHEPQREIFDRFRCDSSGGRERLSKPRPSVNKRRKEEARKERQRNKAQRRAERAAEKANRVVDPSEDPDIAGIVPGPQPPLED
jgi:hypothetical protein